MRRILSTGVVLAFSVPAFTPAASAGGGLYAPPALYSPAAPAAWNARFDKKWNARFNRRFDARWRRQHPAPSPTSYAVASWYYDTNGACAAGYCAQYGVANLSLPFGTRVKFWYGGRSVSAVVDDRGPYVAGRTWDLDERTAAALGFSGVGTVGYRLG